MWDVWAPGLWADGFWADGFWLEAPPPPVEGDAPPKPAITVIAPRRSSSNKRVGLWVDGRPVWVNPGQQLPAPLAPKRTRRLREREALLFM